MIRPTSHNDAGATFSEVIVAMALTSVGVIGAMGAFEAAAKSLGRDALAARALSMAESRLEAKRAAPWGQLLGDDLDHDGVMDVPMHDDGAGGDRIGRKIAGSNPSRPRRARPGCRDSGSAASQSG